MAIFVAAAVLSLFAASNLEPVSLGLWPLPYLVDAPLYLVVLVALLGGLIVGAAAAWVRGGRCRREVRRCRRRSEALARELAATQSRLASEAQTPAATLPAAR
ncbi:MAG: lipopolysaccharide assembly protein LapA domain-containing protein [Stellaceae bacterium]